MKKKILQFIHGLNMGGAETLVKEYSLKFDKTKYDVTILCFYKYHTPIEKQLEDAGINIVYIDDINNYRNVKVNKKVKRICYFVKRLCYLRKYIKEENPDIIHSHLNTNTYVWWGKPSKNTKIFHTVHNEISELWDNSIESKLDFFAAKKLIKSHGMKFVTLHDRMRVETNDFFDVSDTIILNNGIDFERFDNAMPKEVVRKREGISENALVIGHVGRFNEQKNHTFLVDIFYEIYKKNPNAYLLMIGNGDLMEDVIAKLAGMNLEGHYKVLSYRMDIPDLLNAMDYFVFPSLYEGLSVVMIEAQKMKLPCFVSDTISESTQISNLIQWNSLQDSAAHWAEKIINYQMQNIEYYDLQSWDMKNVVKCLEEIYEK